MYTHVHGRSTHISQKVEATQVSINGWTDKLNVISPHNGKLLCCENEWNSDTGNNKDEP